MSSIRTNAFIAGKDRWMDAPPDYHGVHGWLGDKGYVDMSKSTSGNAIYAFDLPAGVK